MEIFGYIKTENDIIISFGSQYSGLEVCGCKKDCEKIVFLGSVRNDGKISIQLSIFNNFDGLKLDGRKIELAED